MMMRMGELISVTQKSSKQYAKQARVAKPGVVLIEVVVLGGGGGGG